MNPYSYVIIDGEKYNCFGIKSCVVQSVNRYQLISLARCILRTIIVNPFNSFLGVSVFADAPQYRNINLNVKQPGVLR